MREVALGIRAPCLLCCEFKSRIIISEPGVSRQDGSHSFEEGSYTQGADSHGGGSSYQDPHPY